MTKEFSESLGPWFGKTMKMIDLKLEEKLFEHKLDLSKMQFIILKKANANNGICQQDLALFANRNKSSLTRMVNTLEKKNYISRIPSKTDKRKKTIVLTNTGKQILKQATPLFHEMSSEIEQGLTKEEIESTINIFKKIQKNINGSVNGPMI